MQFNDLICFRLGSITRRISRYYNNRFAELGITLGQSFVLYSLLERDGRSVKDIAAAVQLDSPAVTGLVDRLVKEGLVIRSEDPDDRRSVNVFLTDRGLQVANESLAITREFNQYLFDNHCDTAVAEIEHSLLQWEEVISQSEIN
ncbi:MAG: MarR family transcriptional regulator [Syntrophomonadaceae bacterium]|nr:MarR family transcriptional regulator [Syntrophomonadaceae bacterium]